MMFDHLDEMEQWHYLKSLQIAYYVSIVLQVAAAIYFMPASFSGENNYSKLIWFFLMFQRMVVVTAREYYKYKSGDLKAKWNLIAFIIITLLGVAIVAGVLSYIRVR